MNGTLFFDLDGTLTDPGDGIVRSMRYALERLGETAPDDLDWCVGPPLLESLASLVGEERSATALKWYRERYDEIGWRENAPYPEIAETLRQLTDAGYRLYVATSKPRVFAERIVSHFGLGPFFELVFGAELDGRHSDKADLLRYALSVVGAPGAATMIGDRRFDVDGARANGLRAIGVTYGYGSHRELEEAGADAIVHSPPELVAAIV